MQTLVYTLRQLRRSPGFTLTSVLTLALGIGSTATMVSVVQTVLLAPPPYPEPDRLVGVAFTYPHEKPNAEQTGSSADFLSTHSRSFSSVGVADDGAGGVNLSYTNAGGTGSTARSVQIEAQRVSRGYLPTLGIAPALGRNFSADEDRHNGPRAVLLSDSLWARVFHRNPAILDQTIRLNEEAYTVIGILPASLRIASRSMAGDEVAPDVWAPLQLDKTDPGYDGDNYQVIARLRPGVSPAAAQAEISTLDQPFYRFDPSYLKWTAPGRGLHGYRAWPLQQVVGSDVRASLLTLLAAVAAVLLVACLNLAGLATSRAMGRSRELALRTALGASRAGLLALMLTESLVLAVAGGALGLLLARVAIPALLAASPIAIPLLHAQAGLSALAPVVLLLSLAATLVFGLLPALAVFRPTTQMALQAGHAAGASRSQARLGRGLIVAQVALAMLLLSAASLLLGSFLKLRAVPSGVEPEKLMIAQATLKGDVYATTLRTTQFLDKVLASLEHTPGVKQVAAINGLPLDRGLNLGARPVDRPNLRQTVQFRAITPGYFRSAGVRLLAGRDITPADRANTPPVAVISETASRRWWPGRSPIGDQVRIGNETNYRVVGIVSDTRTDSLAEPAEIMIYAPFAQFSDAMTRMINGWFSTTLVLRLNADVDMAAPVQQAIQSADPEIPLAKLTTMQSVIDHSLAAPRFFSWLAGGFAGFALLLTVIGLFGLLSYQVSARTREIGIRMALGADRARILAGVVRGGLLLAVSGLLLGAAGSVLVRRGVAAVLEDAIYTGNDPITKVLIGSGPTLAVAACAILLAAAAASYLPARRAAAVEPSVALRSE
jgi:predicted permease